MLTKVVFVCFLAVSAKATHCTYSSECYGDSQTCCSDGICRETCHFCSDDFQCGTGECCDSRGDCKSDCSDHGITTGAVIAIVTGSVIIGCVLIAFMVLSLVACLCRYRRRQHNPGVVVHPPGYQEFGTRPRPQRRLIRNIRRLRPGLFLISTRQTTQSPPSSENNPPSSGNNPPNAGFDPPSNMYSHGEPPPPYYPQPQTGSYPSPQAEGTAPYPPLQVQLPNPHLTK